MGKSIALDGGPVDGDFSGLLGGGIVLLEDGIWLAGWGSELSVSGVGVGGCDKLAAGVTGGLLWAGVYPGWLDVETV